MTKLLSLGLLVLVQIIATINTGEDTLQQVHVFLRHGKRYPSEREFYPKDPHLKLFNPLLYEELTEGGKEESCLLGSALRSHYGTVIGSSYNPVEINVKASAVKRTIESAQLVAHGMFSKCEMRQLATLHTYNVTSTEFEFIQPKYFCPTYKAELDHLLSQSHSINILENNKDLLQHLANNTGRSFTSLIDVFFLHNVFVLENDLNLTLPLWAKNNFSAITNLSIARLAYESGNNVLRRLNEGRSLKNVVNKMKVVVDGSEKVGKVFLYACHDYNIFSLLTLLSDFPPHVPKCSSAVVLSLHKRSNEDYFVKLEYFEDMYSQPHDVAIRNCSCSFSEFESIMRPFLPMNYTKECQATKLLD